MSRGFPTAGTTRRAAEGAAALGLLLFAASVVLSVTVARIAAGITAAALLVRLILDGGRAWRRTALDLPVAAFLAAELLGVIFSVGFVRSARLYLGEWSVLLYYVFSQSLRDRREASRLFDVFVAAGAVVSLYAVWQHLAGWDALRDGPLEPAGTVFVAVGFFGRHETFGVAIMMVAVTGLATAIAPVSWGRRIVYGTAGALAALAVMWSYARTAWIGLAAGLLVALAFRGRRVLAAGAAAMGLAGAAAAFLQPSVAARGSALVNAGDPSSSALAAAWLGAIRVWRSHPITGAGIGSFGTLLARTQTARAGAATGDPHSDFLNVLAGSGIVGAGAFLVMLTLLFRRGLRARAHAPASLSAERALLTAGVAALAAFLVAGLGQCCLTEPETRMIFWFTAACTLVVARAAEVRTRAEGFPGGTS